VSFFALVLAVSCSSIPDQSIIPNCERIKLGTNLSDVWDVRTAGCGGNGATPQLQEYSTGPTADVVCCKDGGVGVSCAIDCQATGFADGGTFQVGHADEWNQCCIFVAHGQVAAVWVNWD
jgi:hypothetical protein